MAVLVPHLQHSDVHAVKQHLMLLCHVKIMVIATAPRDFCIFPQTHDAAHGRNANLHYSIASLFLYVKLFQSCDAGKQGLFRGRRKKRGSQQGEVRQKEK